MSADTSNDDATAPLVAEEISQGTPAADGLVVPVGARVGDYVVERSVRSDDESVAYVAATAENAAGESGPPWARYLLIARPSGAYAGTGEIIGLRLQHPRMLTPRGIVSADSADFLVLESLAASSDLPELLADGPRLTPVEALKTTAGLADGLAYLHRNGVAHLHVSPECIWLVGTRAYLSGIENATRILNGADEAPALIARDANFLARTLEFLAAAPETEQDNACVEALRGIIERGAEGRFETPDELASACAQAVQAAVHVLPGPVEASEQIRLAFDFGSASTVGRVRSENQDALATVLFDVRDDLRGDMPVGLFVVADGMGGEAHGEIASRIGARITVAEVVRMLAAPWIAQPATAQPSESAVAAFAELSTMSVAQALTRAVMEANNQVRHLAAQIQQATGTTLTAIAVTGAQAALAHVGDSRAYLWHGGTLVQLTEDHSLLARLQAMDHPFLNDPSLSVPRNFLYRSLGQEDDTPPDTLEFALTPGDRLMICSDGLWDEVDDATIAQVLAEGATPAECAGRLVERANELGGHDNSTAVVVFVQAREHDDDPQRQVGAFATSAQTAHDDLAWQDGEARDIPVTTQEAQDRATE